MSDSRTDRIWNAVTTVWWFASGDEIMHSSDQQQLLDTVYTWYMNIIDREDDDQ